MNRNTPFLIMVLDVQGITATPITSVLHFSPLPREPLIMMSGFSDTFWNLPLSGQIAIVIYCNNRNASKRQLIKYFYLPRAR